MKLLKIHNFFLKMTNSNNQLNREIRFDWDRNEILEILNMPLIDLMWESQIVHRKFNEYNIQLASLFSIKTGGCEENCSYCSQSIYSASEIKSHPQLRVEEVLARAKICLLYTSPSPRDISGSRMPSSA